MHSHSSLTFRATQALIKNVLENPHDREWSLQGFGMLRTYLDPDRVWRMNLWHSKAMVPGVSTVHDHPWDFSSLVVAGLFTNRRFLELKYEPLSVREQELLDAARARGIPTEYKRMRIKTGEGGGPAGEPTPVRLVPQVDEVYTPGQIYRQQAEEIHESCYVDGTLTINERIRRPDGEHANVFYPSSQWWNDAEPRAATKHDVDYFTRAALEHFR